MNTIEIIGDGRKYKLTIEERIRAYTEVNEILMREDLSDRLREKGETRENSKLSQKIWNAIIEWEALTVREKCDGGQMRGDLQRYARSDAPEEANNELKGEMNMTQITSAIAAKQLRKLNEQRESLLAREKKAKTFTVAIQEDVESVRPAYDFQATQDALVEVEEKIRKLKHTLNCFNSTYVIPEFNMTIDQILIYIPQLTLRKKRLDDMRGKMPKERVQSNFGRGSNIIEYVYANYDISKAEEEYTAVSDELAKAQNALDTANTTVLFEAEIE